MTPDNLIVAKRLTEPEGRAASVPSGRPEPHSGRHTRVAPREGPTHVRAAAEPEADWAQVNPEDTLNAISRRERTYRRTLATADAAAAALAVVVAILVIGGDRLRPGFLLVMPLVIVAAKIQGLYDHDDLVIHKSTLNELPRVVNLATLLTLLIWLCRHLIVVGAPSTRQLLALWFLLIGAITVGRLLGRAIASRRSPVERCLLIGSALLHQRLAAKFQHFGVGKAVLVDSVAVEEVANDHERLRYVTGTLRVHRVIIAPSDHTDPELTMDLVRAVTASGLRASLLPSALAAVGSSVAFDDIGGMPLLGVSRFGLSKSSRAIKRAFDLVGAAVGLVLVAPLFAVLAVVIKLDSAGPVLFRQTRVGRDGKPFMMLKLRTMVDGADAMKNDLRARNEASGLFKIRDDPRITRVGRLLRNTSVDELPQLVNVLTGDMSLVGPRPLVVDEDERVKGLDRRRLHLTPGVTGRWQTLGSARIPLSEMVKIDYLYVANWSLWADVKILLETVSFVLFQRGI